MAALLLVVIVPAMVPARAMPGERIQPFHFVPLFRKHYTRLMAREFRLLLLLDLAQRRAEAHSREVKRAHGEWLRARGRQVQLADLRDLRVRDLAGQMRSGLTGECLRARARLLQMQAADPGRCAAEYRIGPPQLAGQTGVVATGATAGQGAQGTGTASSGAAGGAGATRDAASA